MPAIEECPDGVFIEDTMVVYGDLAVIARSGADERRAGGNLGGAKTVAGQGYRITHITGPGTLDGGDILKIGSTCTPDWRADQRRRGSSSSGTRSRRSGPT